MCLLKCFNVKFLLRVRPVHYVFINLKLPNIFTNTQQQMEDFWFNLHTSFRCLSNNLFAKLDLKRRGALSMPYSNRMESVFDAFIFHLGAPLVWSVLKTWFIFSFWDLFYQFCFNLIAQAWALQHQRMFENSVGFKITTKLNTCGHF